MKNYQAQTPQNLVLTKILQNTRKMSTSTGLRPVRSANDACVNGATLY